jgi:hypothetical protein
LVNAELVVDIDELEIEGLNYAQIEVRREWKNIDILILIENLVICIENKVDGQDHINQLSNYRSIIDQNFKDHKKIFVYLSPGGEQPTSIQERQFYTPYSYEQISVHLDQYLETHGHLLSQSVQQYLTDYQTTLKRELMKNDSVNELANKIYKNHKDLFDFVFENKSDIASDIYPVLVKKIQDSNWVIGSKNKGYARFLTKSLDPIIPRKGQGWPLKECFLFEIDFLWNKNRAVFKTVIAPCDSAIQNLLSKALQQIPGHKKPSGKKWLVHFQHSWKFDTSGLVEIDDAAILNLLEAEWPVITEIVEKVEAEILKIKGNLLTAG